ncbi:DUF4347 domain-containing protein [Sphingomonas sp. MMS24-JH45]
MGRSLSPGGDILIYGCDFAAGDRGAQALAAFAHATGADVAASTDTTGYAGQRRRLDAGGARRRDRGAVAVVGGLGPYARSQRPGADLGRAGQPHRHGRRRGDRLPRRATITTATPRARPDVGVGAVATWANAATFQGRSIDLKATVVSLTQGDAVQFNRVTGAGTGPDDPTFLLRDLTTGDAPNGRDALDPGRSRHRRAAAREHPLHDRGHRRHRRRPKHARNGDRLLPEPRLLHARAGHRHRLHLLARHDPGVGHAGREQSARRDADAAVGRDLRLDRRLRLSTLTYTLSPNAQTSQAQFYHDGDADFVYTDPVYVSIPRLDLDADDSTAAGNDAHATFTEDGPAVPVVDADVVVTNPMGPTAITGATVTLTNWKAGDGFSG